MAARVIPRFSSATSNGAMSIGGFDAPSRSSLAESDRRGDVPANALSIGALDVRGEGAARQIDCRKGAGTKATQAARWVLSCTNRHSLSKESGGHE
jgi:hypothetical protein